eukprot:m.342754 g.342754  ORF g.342754 m.342754 type:complete len:83 (-) comp16126_c0_seq4:189-437(-)
MWKCEDAHSHGATHTQQPPSLPLPFRSLVTDLCRALPAPHVTFLFPMVNIFSLSLFASIITWSFFSTYTLTRELRAPIYFPN